MKANNVNFDLDVNETNEFFSTIALEYKMRWKLTIVINSELRFPIIQINLTMAVTYV